MNSIKQEAREAILLLKKYWDEDNQKFYDYVDFSDIKSLIDRSYSQGVADERKRAAGKIRDYKTGTPNLNREEQRIQDLLEEIATEIERGE